MKIIKEYEDGPVLMEAELFGDDRGYFYESFNEKEFKEKVADVTFVQDNQSSSAYGTIRGMHFQKGEYAQAKLVRVVKGTVVDVVVDVRPDSKNYLQTYYAYLSEKNHRQFFVPRGFAHGFIALEPDTIFQYKCDNFYNKEAEGSFNYRDVKDFDWEYYVPSGLFIVSEKDDKAPKLDSCDFSSFNGIAKCKKYNEVDLNLVKDILDVGNLSRKRTLFDAASVISGLKKCRIQLKDGREGKIMDVINQIYHPDSFTNSLGIMVASDDGQAFIVRTVDEIVRIYYDDQDERKY